MINHPQFLNTQNLTYSFHITKSSGVSEDATSKVREFRSFGVGVLANGTPNEQCSKPWSRWWFQIFFIFTPTWGNDPI